MAKESFLVVSLKESKTKKLAQVITNETSLKILNYLANKDGVTETELAEALGMPISTVHYNLQALLDTKMVKWDKFHYSEKGKEVRHYAVANKYILIAPEKEAGLREKLKSILPISVVMLAATVAIQLISSRAASFAAGSEARLMAESAVVTEADAALKSVPAAASAPQPWFQLPSSLTGSMAFWFALGAFGAILLFILISWIMEKRGRK